MSKSPFMTVPEAGAQIGVGAKRAYQLVSEGIVPAVRIGPRRLCVPRDAFDVWLREQSERALANVRVGEDDGRAE